MQPTPVFLPRESQGRGSLVGCRLWGHRAGYDCSDLAAAAAPRKKSFDQPRQHVKKQRHYFMVCLVKAIAFPVVMDGCDMDVFMWQEYTEELYK